MPRLQRVFVEGLVYHVYNRVGRGEAPFTLEDGAQTFWSLLEEVAKRDSLTVYAWCIMPNHYHLAVRTSTVPLWRSIRFLQHRYTQLFNRRAGVLGPLWQSRYKARPVTEQGSLLRLLAYIHLNPVAAGMVEDPARYRWSGHRELVRRVKEPLILVDPVFSLFGGTRQQARQAYVSLLRQERKAPWLGAEIVNLPWWRETPEVEPPVRGVDALGSSSGPTRRRLTAAAFLARVAPLAKVTIEELASPRRTPELVDARELVGGVAVERWGIHVKGLAEALGKSREGVSKWVRRAARRRSEDDAFFRRMEDLDGRLADDLEATPS